MITIASKGGPAATRDRLSKAITSRGMTNFAHIDHAAGAKAAGMELRPTDLFIFGTAKAGTPLMQLDQTIGIELPLKMLIYQDAHGMTVIAYDDPQDFAKRHSVGEAAASIIATMTAALKAVAADASGAD
jgi:uncharacterized protein (DUF302 family)